MRKKYKITLNHIEQPGGIYKLERDGFSRSEIMNVVHKETNQKEFSHKTRTDQREIVSRLFNRES